MAHIDRRRSIVVLLGAVLATVGSATPVLAHTGHDESGLWAGLTHPVLGLDHLVAMVVVGILAATLRRPLAVPAAFVAAMVVGGVLGLAGMALPGAEIAIAASVVAFGAALVAGRAIGDRWAIGLVALAGIAHGHAHGVEAPSAASPVVYVAGFVAATIALHAVGVAIGLGLRDRLSGRSLVGAAAVGVGIGFLAGVI